MKHKHSFLLRKTASFQNLVQIRELKQQKNSKRGKIQDVIAQLPRWLNI